MKKHWLLFLMSGFLSCADPVEIPQDVLPKDKMALILTDVQQAEAAIQSFSMEVNDSTRAIAYGYYHTIFKKHQVTPEQFRKSFAFYSANLKIMDKIYDDVIINLSTKEAEEAAR